VNLVYVRVSTITVVTNARLHHVRMEIYRHRRHVFAGVLYETTENATVTCTMIVILTPGSRKTSAPLDICG